MWLTGDEFDDTVPRAEHAAATVSDSGLSVVVRRVERNRYAFKGRTRLARGVEVVIEDKRNVLWGAEAFPVTNGEFSFEVDVGHTDSTTIFAYLSDYDGTRQWVIPIPLDSAVVNWTAPGMEQR
ncbi:hypothetical protein [Longimicrobium terrae]|uniref:Uncharacterized protein n=1 Tax=Longimicrobium terrae TaxID=1639882 RepID=A0A841H613_9BACT|nr:hypothetical protein [Longimicrobium terrae]MBB4639083.1 hypothetical protein [Longimicrobium terrae]MBB6073316.1 hypothetical protein [Longimicrobium terrae]NNC28755.1 hypothetical protein [Longimicrobium terrae]